MEVRVLLVLVPKPGTPAAAVIDAGSGVVRAADIEGTARVTVYFEGNRFGTAPRFYDRVLAAAQRLDQRYPTVARGEFARTDFDIVGTFMYSPDWKLAKLELSDEARVASWTR